MPKAVIHNKVRLLRHLHDGMTQQELADRIGCTRQTVILLEHERYVPSLALALRIGEVFGLTVNEIFSFAPVPQRVASTGLAHDDRGSGT